ncbi:four-helix bundle copper-binding protein [Peribacillus sp. SCS-37]|uniref:four-helix bundle copper-binding protein n=1 Tax=Paraperibacillus esterisolvens TaxID=3115296 RepID=UPI003905B6C1
MTGQKYESVIRVLHECMEACNHCFDSCLQEENVGHMAECIRLDRECADICGYFEQALGRATPFVSELAGICATICEACGNECKRHDHDHCQRCADACFACARECRALAA